MQLNDYLNLKACSQSIIFSFSAIIIALFFFSIGFIPIYVHSLSNDLLQFDYSRLDQSEQKNFCYKNLPCHKGSGASGISFGAPEDVVGYCMDIGNPECNSKLDKFKFSEAQKFDYTVTFTSNTCSQDKSCVNISFLTNYSFAANKNKNFDQYEGNKNNTSVDETSTNQTINNTLIQKCTESSGPSCLNINTETTSGSAIMDTIKKFVNSSKR